MKICDPQFAMGDGRLARRFVAGVFLVMAGLSPVQGGGILGGVEVKEGRASGSAPVASPDRVYVQDFDLAVDHPIAEQHAVEQPRARRLMERLHPESDPNVKARELVKLMKATLVEALNAGGLHAEPYSTNVVPPKGESWLVRGVFTEVGEGNRVKRAVIGMGRGATSMEVQVAVSDLARDPHKAFALFGTVKDPAELPGAVVTLNPYIAAAGFVVAKNASGNDVRQTAREIAAEILRYRNELDPAPSPPR